MNFIDIENAGFRSWPAKEELNDNGVILRSSNGFTKRANSANVLEQQAGNYKALVSRCEKYFFEKQLPCIFRLPSFANNNGLDNYLHEHLYQSIDHSLVLQRSLVGATFNHCELTINAAEDWIQSYCDISDIDSNSQLTHIEMLKRIKDKTLMAVLVENGVEIACGLGVMSDDCFGLFDVATRSNYRNQGCATRLLNGMLSWAVANGARQSYLQVVANNDAAVCLYRKLGYEDCYEYWYRVKHENVL